SQQGTQQAPPQFQQLPSLVLPHLQFPAAGACLAPGPSQLPSATPSSSALAATAGPVQPLARCRRIGAPGHPACQHARLHRHGDAGSVDEFEFGRLEHLLRTRTRHAAAAPHRHARLRNTAVHLDLARPSRARAWPRQRHSQRASTDPPPPPCRHRSVSTGPSFPFAE
ncbi:MAG: hypothetical protein ACK56I_18445, partial [bacterium]